MDLLAYNFLLTLISATDISMITDIFKYKNAKNQIYFHCNKRQTEIAVQKILNYNNFMTNSFVINNDNNYSIPFSHQKLGIVVHTSCAGWSDIFKSAYIKTAFKYPNVWLFVTNNLSATVNELSTYPIDVDSDVLIAVEKHNITELFELYCTGFSNNGVWITKKTGYWNTKLMFEKNHRFDLRGIMLKATVVMIQKLKKTTLENVLKEPTKQIVNDPIHRLKFFTLLCYVGDLFNISYYLERTNSWGYWKNGSFDGMVGALQRHETDIGGSPVFFRKDRADVVDYAGANWNSRQTFIFVHPKHPSGYLSVYSRPMSTVVWYCTIAVLSLAWAALCIILKLLNNDVSRDSTTSFAWLAVWSAFCQQGLSVTKIATSARIVIFITFVFTLTLYQYYNATVVSSLLRDTPKNIKTLKDLLKSNLKVGVEDVLYSKDYLKYTTDPIAIELYKKKIIGKNQYNFFTAEVGMELTRRGGFAFHVDSATGYRIMKETFTEKQLCDIQEVHLYPPQYTYAVVRKGSPYKEHLVYGIRRMFESGLASRLKSIWDESKPPCVRTPDTSLFGVSIQEFSMALIILVSGMMLANCILLCEIYAHRIRTCSRQGFRFNK